MTYSQWLLQPPLGETISTVARTELAKALAAPTPPEPETIADLRRDAVERSSPIAERRQATYGVCVSSGTLGDVPAYWVLPAGMEAPQENAPLLLNFHGGGFLIDYAALPESIPVAALSGFAVASVLYRLAPEYPYPAAVDDALAAYRAALVGRSADRIGLFGTSAGAILTVQLLARIKAEGLPMPAAAGAFSVAADFARTSDCEGFLPPLAPGLSVPQLLATYRGSADARDPLLSPLFGDLTGLPPILLMTSTRDQFLSQTVLLHEALLAAEVPVQLRVFEGMLHAFWTTLEAPETDVALAAQADFFKRHLTC